jgi:hypothetical protein
MMEPLLDRLLVDAQTRAARSEWREALLLLRWAATIASRTVMPRVLLAFHRVRALHVPGNRHHGGTLAIEPVESDRLGFPVPRFASRPPELDRHAFVPSPRFTPGTQPGAHPGPVADARPRPRIGIRAAVVALMVGSGAAWVLTVDPAQGGAAAATEAAAAALRVGKPRDALALLDRLPNPNAHALVVRGRALLAVADTQAAALSFRKSAEHPGASAEDVLAAARELARLPCCAFTAADAYVLAFERGIPSDEYLEIAQHLDRAGRYDQAKRIRELGAASR